MALLIGMDEAGLGPNLGPFVVAATVWEVTGSPDGFDFWTAFDTVLTNAPADDDPRLHVADSKQVFQPNRGLAALERGVWSALHLCESVPRCFRELCHALSQPLVKNEGPAAQLESKCDKPRARGSAKSMVVETGKSSAKNGRPKAMSLFDGAELAAARGPHSTAKVAADETPLPWYEGDDFSLPRDENIAALDGPWRSLCQTLGVRLVAVRADVVEPLRFNRLVRRYDNKSQATSRLAMSLLRSIWHPDDDESFIVADKHGGRNRYDMLLAETFDCDVDCLEEGAEISRYQVGRGTLQFQPRAESHGPVALASMVAKYVRELAMHQFNRFWQQRIPDLKPTQGYPLDARRFWDDIDKELKRLKIHDDIIWRER